MSLVIIEVPRSEALQLDKLAVLRREIVTAIKLYFQSEDEVSLWILTSAAYNVAKDLNHIKGGPPMMREASEFADSESVYQAILKSNSYYINYFTQAENDSDLELTFNPLFLELMIYEVTEKYRDLTDTLTSEMTCFRIWFLAWSQFAPSVHPLSIPLKSMISKSYSQNERKRFFDEFDSSSDQSTFDATAPIDSTNA
jgi:hypothetical protein